MTKITPDVIKSLITRNGALFVPESVTSAIGSCVVSSTDVVEQEGQRLKKLYDEYDKPIKIDYSGDATIDAYSVYYLPRNTLVPKVAILCCLYYPSFQTLPDRLSVLDLGSGTGAVVLGLLDLFHDNALSGTQLDVVALDSSLDSLRRQRQLVDRVGLRGSSYQCYQADLSVPTSCQSKLSIGAPYDMVFAANIFTELDGLATDALFQNVAPLLAQNGILVNVEAARKYTRKQLIRIIKKARESGFNIYYPCPPALSCPKSECWMWREDRFECPDIRVGNELIETTPIQKAYWIILCKQPCSIFDVLLERNATFTWGVKAHIGKECTVGDNVEQKYEVCTPSGFKGLVHKRRKDDLSALLRSEPYKRGSFIGWADDFSEVETWDILSGFISYEDDEI